MSTMSRATCVKCHATVVRGSADFGISCESCHGAGKDYLKPHQEKGAYQAVARARHEGHGQEAGRVGARNASRVTCSATTPATPQLVKAGHPTGADFDFGMKFEPVAGHWTSKYTANQIAAIGNPLRNALARKATASAPAAARRRTRTCCRGARTGSGCARGGRAGSSTGAAAGDTCCHCRVDTSRRARRHRRRAPPQPRATAPPPLPALPPASPPPPAPVDRHGARCARVANAGEPRRRAAGAHRAIARATCCRAACGRRSG